MSVHAHTILALLPVDVEGIFLIIALRGNDNGKPAVYELQGKAKTQLLGVSLNPYLRMVKNQ